MTSIYATDLRGHWSGRTDASRDSIERQVAAVRSELPGIVDEFNAKFPSPIYHDICRGIHSRIRQLSA